MENRPDKLPKKPAKSGCCGETTTQPLGPEEEADEEPKSPQVEAKDEACCCG